MSRDTLAKGALEDIVEAFHAVLSGSRKYAILEDIADHLAEKLSSWIDGRHATFHCWELLLHGFYLPIGLRRVVMDGARLHAEQQFPRPLMLNWPYEFRYRGFWCGLL